MARPFKRGLLGGTFDHFHKGHEKLILNALEKCDFLEIWITSDNIASKKIGGVQSFEERNSFLNEWIKIKSESGELMDAGKDRILTKKLEDKVGPAEWRTDCDAIICTIETFPACEKINSTRINSDLHPLNIIKVEHLLTEDGTVTILLVLSVTSPCHEAAHSGNVGCGAAADKSRAGPQRVRWR